MKMVDISILPVFPPLPTGRQATGKKSYETIQKNFMRKIEIQTTCKKLLADVFTPVGIYLRLRDRFRDTILLESTDHHAAENSYSFI